MKDLVPMTSRPTPGELVLVHIPGLAWVAAWMDAQGLWRTYAHGQDTPPVLTGVLWWVPLFDPLKIAVNATEALGKREWELSPAA